MDLFFLENFSFSMDVTHSCEIYTAMFRGILKEHPEFLTTNALKRNNFIFFRKIFERGLPEQIDISWEILIKNHCLIDALKSDAHAIMENLLHTGNLTQVTRLINVLENTEVFFTALTEKNIYELLERAVTNHDVNVIKSLIQAFTRNNVTSILSNVFIRYGLYLLDFSLDYSKKSTETLFSQFDEHGCLCDILSQLKTIDHMSIKSILEIWHNYFDPSQSRSYTRPSKKWCDSPWQSLFKK